MCDTFRANTREKQQGPLLWLYANGLESAESFLEDYYSRDKNISSGGQVGSLKAIMEHYSKSN